MTEVHNPKESFGTNLHPTSSGFISFVIPYFYASLVVQLKIFFLTRGQTAEARRTTILQPVEQKPHSQKDRQDEKEEGYVPDEGTR